MAKVAFIEWLDASGSDSTMDVTEAHRLKPLSMKTAGVVIVEDADHVTIGQDTWESPWGDARVRSLQTIPRAHITSFKVWEMKDGEKSTRKQSRSKARVGKDKPPAQN